ncbi:MAG: hypothetical protein LBG89_03640 [Rickettsiales bacterium]|jgi:hypothetical protein|nr:hypothetical protein [Rickettsiales bacterium]
MDKKALPLTKKIYQCTCYGEALEIDKDEDGLSISLWNAGSPWGSSLWFRIKTAYNLVMRNKYYTDYVILDAPTARQFGNDIIELMKESNSAKKHEKNP